MLVNHRLQTHSKYVILIAFPLQQWLRERASMLRYTHIVLFTKLSVHSLSSVYRAYSDALW